MGCDAVKVALMDHITSPDLDLLIIKAIQACVQCKNFGPTHLNALLQPITHRHPFKLLVGDYLSMPPGKGGYHTIALYLDTFSQHMWAFKYKMAGTAKTIVNALSTITKAFITPETLMTDGSTYFDNNMVWEFCNVNQCKHHITPVYSPWVNGLVEGMNKILLYVMKWLCAPELREDNSMDGWDQLP
jgi:Integrase core domain